MIKAFVSALLVIVVGITVVRTLDTVDADWPSATSVALASCLCMAGALTSGVRWWILLRSLGSTVGLRTSLALKTVALTFNVALPTGFGGDAFKVWELRRRGDSTAQVAASVFLDRFIGLIVMIATVLSSALWLLPSAAMDISGGAGTSGWLWGAVALGIAMIAAGFGALALARRLPERWRRFSLVRLLMEAATYVRSMRAPVITVLSAIGLSIVVQMFIASSAWVIGRSIGLEAGLPEILLATCLAVVISIIPISLGGWGVREGTLAGFLVLFGAHPAHASLTALGFGLLLLITAIPGIPIWLAMKSGRRDRSHDPEGADLSVPSRDR